MKTFRKNYVLIKLFFIAVLFGSVFYFSSCKKDPCKEVICQNGGTSSSSGDECICNCPTGYEGQFCETKKCSVNGNTVNIGSTTGGTFYHSVSAGHEIGFNNTNLNFSLRGGNGYQMMSVGPQICLDFSYTGTPTAGSVAYIEGNGYVGHYTDGHIVKFIAGYYNNGSVKITYVYQ